jgi:hypothetical protein
MQTNGDQKRRQWQPANGFLGGPAPGSRAFVESRRLLERKPAQAAGVTATRLADDGNCDCDTCEGRATDEVFDVLHPEPVGV